MSDPNLWLTVLLASLISLVAIYATVAPLLKPGRALLVLEDDKLAGLLGRKDAILQAIKDLEFDYQVGKMSQEDYQRMDQRLRRQAIVLMQQIDKLAPASTSLDEQLEGIIAQFRQTSAGSTSPSRNEDDEAATSVASATVAPVVASVAAPVESPSPRYCTQCGKPVEAGHNFCANCGTPVAQRDSAAQV